MRDPDYKPMWCCSECGSMNVETLEMARFDPNNDFAFIDSCEIHHYDWCRDCDCEVTLDEAKPLCDPWGHEYGEPMYWVPPMDDEYWEAKGDPDTWTVADEQLYWDNRLGETNANN